MERERALDRLFQAMTADLTRLAVVSAAKQTIEDEYQQRRISAAQREAGLASWRPEEEKAAAAASARHREIDRAAQSLKTLRHIRPQPPECPEEGR